MPRRPQLLILNPNTSDGVSQALLRLAQRQAGDACEVRVQTARFGARYISDEVSFAIAGHALLDAYAFDRAQTDRPVPDAVLIACFGDPGLQALRGLCACHVLGLAQASMLAAHTQGPFAIITGGQAWVPMLARLVAELGLADRLTSIRAVDKTGAQLAANTEAAVTELAGLCVQLLRHVPATRVILLGGAALGGMASDIERELGRRGFAQVQIMDSVSVSLQEAIQQACGPARSEHTGAGGVPQPITSVSLSPELQHLLEGATEHGLLTQPTPLQK